MKGSSGQTAADRPGNSPVIVLSYPYSGAALVQEVLAAGAGLACTAGTGILPVCEVAAEAWRRVEGSGGQVLSPLAVSTIRGMVTAQISIILAGHGQRRWCELATLAPAAVVPFLQAFPAAGIVCVHRRSVDVIRAGIRANPWGLQGYGIVPYLMAHPGNSVAALAAQWARSAEELLAFQAGHPSSTHRVRYEDVAESRGSALAEIRGYLGLPPEPLVSALPSRPDVLASGAEQAAAEPQVPVNMIPTPLRERITRLHAELGYSPL